MNNKTNTKPIVVIGDVHGLTCWKDIVKVHKDSMFVFLGDYCDPYEDIKPIEWRSLNFPWQAPEALTKDGAYTIQEERDVRNAMQLCSESFDL